MISYSRQSVISAHTFYFNPTLKSGYKLCAKIKALRYFSDLSNCELGSDHGERLVIKDVG
jgi:hypothetical protein